jgi:hypothetical protein
MAYIRIPPKGGILILIAPFTFKMMINDNSLEPEASPWIFDWGRDARADLDNFLGF